MYMILDLGTSNTRLWLCRENTESICKTIPFGAGITKSKGKEFLFSQLKQMIVSFLTDAQIKESDVEHIMVSGMAGSELGLMDIPHINIPSDVYTLADNLQEHVLTQIATIPFVFVPGLKKVTGHMFEDIMRGEETEVAGILEIMPQCCSSILVLPGTHNKIISVNAQGAIEDFSTTMSGEILNSIINTTILSGQVSHEFSVDAAWVLQGAAWAKENGLNAALFHIRVMAKNNIDMHALSSFLYGSVLSQDIPLIQKHALGKPVYIGGRSSLKQVFGILLGDRAMALPEQICKNAVSTGLHLLHKLLHTRANRSNVLAAIEKEKIIAIIRQPDPDTFLDAMQALYRGGIRLAEITFDRSGKTPKEDTAELIKKLNECTPLLVGAGTVTTREDVLLAWKAGAAYIISPNCDREIIQLTRQLGMVSIPAAFTPTEITHAIDCGADFVKLFPADQVGAGYVKAIKAPIADAKLLAVGGVDVTNASAFMQIGFSGLAIGSSLYDRELVNKKNWPALEALAKQFVAAVK